MLNQLNFFAPPIQFPTETLTFKKKVLEFIDGYFYVGDKRAFIIEDRPSKNHPSVYLGRLPAPKDNREKIIRAITTALKIASYFTIVLPVIIFTLKIVVRLVCDFKYLSTSYLPKINDIFKATFYTNTYLPPLDFSEKNIQQDLLVNFNNELNQKAQTLFSNPVIAETFAKPLSFVYDEIIEKNKIFEENGFKILSRKLAGNQLIPFSSVLEHPDLPGWIIKTCARRTPKDMFLAGLNNDVNEMALFSKNEGLMRIENGKRIKKAADELGMDIVIPTKKLVQYPQTTSSKPEEKYFLLCEKLDILSPEEVIQKISKMSEMEQRTLAQNLAKLIKKAGIIDFSFSNISFTRSGRIAIYDTEPAGSMRLKKKSFWKQLFADSPASLEKSARIGLNYFWRDNSFDPRLAKFNEEILKAYNEVKTPALSKWKIALGITTFGLYPLFALINAVILKQRIELLAQDIQMKCNEVQQQPPSSLEELSKFTRYLKVENKNILQLVNGIPYSAHNEVV